MWLTGFDVPCLDVIYIDKWLKMHNLMQTIARVNRVYKDKESNIIKQSGLVVDYIGIWKNLNNALSFYNDNGDNVKLTGKTSEEVKQQLLEINRNIIEKYFKSFEEIKNLPNDGKELMIILDKFHNFLIKENILKEFVNDTKLLNKLLTICNGILSVMENKITVFFILLRKTIINFELSRIDFEQDVNKLGNKISNAIICNGNFNTNKFKKVSLNALIDHLKKTRDKKANPELTSEIIKITAYKVVEELKKQSIIRAKKLSEKITELINSLKDGHISFEDFKKFMVEAAEEALNDSEAKKMGLSDAEYSFYEMISQDKFSNTTIESKKLIDITRELYNEVKNNVTNLWNLRSSDKIRVRSKIKLILLKYNFPPESYSDEENSLKSQLTKQIEELIENDFKFE